MSAVPQTPAAEGRQQSIPRAHARVRLPPSRALLRDTPAPAGVPDLATTATSPIRVLVMFGRGGPDRDRLTSGTRGRNGGRNVLHWSITGTNVGRIHRHSSLHWSSASEECVKDSRREEKYGRGERHPPTDSAVVRVTFRLPRRPPLVESWRVSSCRGGVRQGWRYRSWYVGNHVPSRIRLW